MLDLRRNAPPGSIVLHYFFQVFRHDRSDINYLWANLLAQLLDQAPRLKGAARLAIPEGTQPTVLLADLLIESLGTIRSMGKNVYIVLDGLDDSPDVDLLDLPLKAISTLGVKMAFFVRETPTVGNINLGNHHILRHGPGLFQEIVSHEDDVRQYIAMRISERPSGCAWDRDTSEVVEDVMKVAGKS